MLWGATALGPIVPIYFARGGDEALLEAWENFYSLVIVFGIAFLVFLYHLWLAPYKILNEQNKRTNKRIDDLANAPEPGRVVDEKAAERRQLIEKKNFALQEMRTFLACIRAIEERSQYPSHMQSVQHYDHELAAIREKRADWFPKDLSVRDLKPWTERIIATLEHNDYEVAGERIQRAFGAGTWNERKKKP